MNEEHYFQDMFAVYSDQTVEYIGEFDMDDDDYAMSLYEAADKYPDKQPITCICRDDLFTFIFSLYKAFIKANLDQEKQYRLYPIDLIFNRSELATLLKHARKHDEEDVFDYLIGTIQEKLREERRLRKNHEADQ